MLNIANTLKGYTLESLDGEIGNIEEFYVDDQSWTIRYLVINTKNWWPGNKVLVSPQWIKRVSSSESKVFISLSRETVKRSPKYTEKSILTREYESELHRHYDRRGYWEDEPVAKKGYAGIELEEK